MLSKVALYHCCMEDFEKPTIFCHPLSTTRTYWQNISKASWQVLKGLQDQNVFLKVKIEGSKTRFNYQLDVKSNIQISEVKIEG